MRRKSFEKLLSSNSSGMQINRYVRLMWLCCVDLLIAIPIDIFNIVDVSTNQPVYPWVSWADTQADWYHVDYLRRIIFDQQPLFRFAMNLFMSCTCLLTFLFFILFGFTRETKKFYRNTYYWCMKPFGIKKPQRASQFVHGPLKRTWLDKLLRREVIPLNSTSNTTGSIPVFSSQARSIPTAQAKTMTMTSATNTLDWEESSRVIVIDGRLSIPDLRNGTTSFESYDEREKAPQRPSEESHKPYQSPV
jgi:hypothetical protein